ncbi:hypothetical protein BS47DRAFT_1394050 [Hydnum rufescens UP504]|uniref:Amidase domain-containing protein n=1 Tax=Hydnum rufescens UP504 TaxID=1448309 RepID=A0A9P6AVK7_9AGAM|nr:hypothetical protein BS47DRAFT_1394050 [Hydnum rufescens UP504]
MDLKSIPNGLNVLHAVSKSGLLTAHELEITDTVDINTTPDCLRQGVWSSAEVATVYSNLLLPTKSSVHFVSATRHKLGGPYSHVFPTEIFADEALARAMGLDEHLARTGYVEPLHGLPLSLKDAFLIKDLELRWSISLTPGGSSGGEGALIPLCGISLGVGTDIGGCDANLPLISPAAAGFSFSYSPYTDQFASRTAFTSLYALRSSISRFPHSRVVNSFEGHEVIQSVLGPMAQCLFAVRMSAKTVVETLEFRSGLREPAGEH